MHCLTLAHVGESPSIFADFLPLVLVCCLSELNSRDCETYLYEEMVAVFSNVGHRVDIKDSCQFIFSFFANVEKQFNIIQKSRAINTSSVVSYFEQFIFAYFCLEDFD